MLSWRAARAACSRRGPHRRRRHPEEPWHRSSHTRRQVVVCSSLARAFGFSLPPHRPPPSPAPCILSLSFSPCLSLAVFRLSRKTTICCFSAFSIIPRRPMTLLYLASGFVRVASCTEFRSLFSRLGTALALIWRLFSTRLSIIDAY